MKAYVQYYETKLDGRLDEALGNDGYRPLDARLSLCNMIAVAERKNFKGYTNYEIRHGDFKRYMVVFKSGGCIN